MAELEFIITGTGHCGSGYIAKLLTKLGIKTGHEEIFTVNIAENKNNLRGDSSMAAAPRLADYPDQVIVHQLRDPVKFIRSMYNAINLFQPNNQYGNWMRQQCPKAAQGLDDTGSPTLEWGAAYWLYWNKMIEPHQHHYFKVEDFDVSALLHVIGYHRTGGQIMSAVNNMSEVDYHRHAKTETPQVDMDLLRQLPIYPELREYAERYGYSV